MNEIVNKFLLAGDRFIPEMHLRHPDALDKSGFTQGACGPFPKIRGIQKFKETGDSRCTYQNKLDKASFQYDMDYGDFMKTCDKAFSTAEKSKI